MLLLARTLVLVSASADSAVAADAGPAVTAGRHLAELCVSTATAAAPGCGPAQVDLRRDGSATVRIDDIAYHLLPKGGDIAVVMTHGAMQVDDFIATGEWVGRTLRFNDEARRMRYEVRFGGR